MLNRRQWLRGIGSAPLSGLLPALAQEAPDFGALKQGYAQRLKKLLAQGVVPYVDLESSCNSQRFDMDAFARDMDSLGIGLTAMSADIGRAQYAQGVRYDDLSERLLAHHPSHFIPVGNGGQGPCFLETPSEFLAAQEAAWAQGKILLLGEYEFRHYPSPRQVRRGGEEESERDVNIPINGPSGHQLFMLSEKTGMAFQIHYEIEDALLPALEQMLTRYPKARVIWCHLAQIRYIERAPQYGPAYVESLIKRFPNLHWDTAFGSPKSVYPVSGQRQARVWDGGDTLKSEWKDLLVAYPGRFVSALDLGADRMDKLQRYDAVQRNFLGQLPREVQHRIAYGNAWELLFGEAFS
jgi:hypothetical protein